MIRPARPDDAPAIFRMIGDLAEYEKEPESVTATEDDIREALFGPEPAAFCHIAEHTGEDGSVEYAGFALWFLTFSTWTGQRGIHLEDLFVHPHMRGHGYGLALLRELAAICVERGYPRLEWAVLDWNGPAIRFYDSLGSSSLDEWTDRRLDGAALAALGSRAG
ncbi:L-amino acid N-acyltransferase YncA [Nocardiopsis sp. Huas11]|uniref:GNAT family N-acetyltransferase n=1 Tax=Nocardiopsis sp. Huas11 TaxID=2183912 RepID=UPI000EAF9DB6|nr:GNAT family N-acetyltransferase [Nocardiopsis sp. Huas11]RKS05290.1 L-amino acid N-acyltransferase YncA [Nocardiopsis sp. Huas11]